MKMLKYLSIGIIGLLLISGCSPVKILETQKIGEFTLANYSTFDFYQMDVDGNTGPEFSERVHWIMDEVTAQMEERGVKQSDQEPELLINIGLAFVEKVQTRETDFRTDAPRYVGSLNYSWQSETVAVGTYEEGTMVVHFVDSEDLILLWEGIAQSVLLKGDKAAQKNIATGVSKLMADL